MLMDPAADLEQLLVGQAEPVAVERTHGLVLIGVQTDVEALFGELHEGTLLHVSSNGISSTPPSWLMCWSPVFFVQNGHAALRPSSITFMAVKVASVKPPIVYRPRSPDGSADGR